MAILGKSCRLQHPIRADIIVHGSVRVTESLEMYLETIDLLRERSKLARVTDIARELRVSKPSVHAALHELERRGLIEHEHYGEVYLSSEGKAAAAEIRRRHGLLTAFLRDIVGVRAETAEQDACRIEHYLSAETMEGISRRVGEAKSRGGEGPEAGPDEGARG
jgi:DtxR family transcriptional regulator, Mn-dependent transcriptional regulator